MAKKQDDNPLDSLRLAVARARSEGDGNIGKTDAPTPGVQDSAEGDVLTELGIPEAITKPIKRRARSKAPTKKKVARSSSAVTPSKQASPRSKAPTAATGDAASPRARAATGGATAPKARTTTAGTTAPKTRAATGRTAAAKTRAASESTTAPKARAKRVTKAVADVADSPAPAKKPAKAASPKRATTRRKAAAPHTSQVVFSETRRSIPERDLLVRNRVIAGSATDHRVEAYRQLRSQTLRLMRKHELKNFAITSAHEGAGKTLTGANLAISMSMERNQTVLLVDLDLRNPGVHRTLGLEAKYGVIDHLRSGVAVEDILVDPGYERLLVLPGRAVAGNLSEFLTAPEMSSLVSEITSRYDDRLVIFDLPPLLRNDDAMSFLPQVDACMFVIEEDVTTTSQVRQCMGLLADTLLLGTVLNKAA